MINTQPYHDKLEALKEWMDKWVDYYAYNNSKVVLDLYFTTGLLFYNSTFYPSFDEFYEYRRNK